MEYTWNADRLVALFILMGTTEEAVATAFTFNPKKVHQWASGDDRPSVDELLTICNYYNVPPSFFFQSKEVDRAKDKKK